MNYSQCLLILLPLLVFHPYLRAWTSNLEQSICANKYTVSKGFRADNVNYRLWIIFRAPNWFEERENKLIVLSRLLGWPLNFLAESKEKKVCHLCLSFRSKLPSGIGVGRRNNGFPFAWLLWDTRKKSQSALTVSMWRRLWRRLSCRERGEPITASVRTRVSDPWGEVGLFLLLMIMLDNGYELWISDRH